MTEEQAIERIAEAIAGHINATEYNEGPDWLSASDMMKYAEAAWNEIKAILDREAIKLDDPRRHARESAIARVYLA